MKGLTRGQNRQFLVFTWRVGMTDGQWGGEKKSALANYFGSSDAEELGKEG
jgi:hypothetical protein